jgi:tetratricopeptide (TPR) repeat protein
MKILTRFAILCIAVAALPVQAADLAAEILSLKAAWAQVNYHATGDARTKGIEALVPRGDALAAANPGRADAIIWQGILQSSYADAKGGLGALSAAKKARALFEKAIAIDERALDGSALASLGVLYSKVPGFPVGFGDDKRARQLLQKALAVNPDSIDTNFFYGEFLVDEGEAAAARPYLQKALQAPARAGQEAGDEGRRAQVAALLRKLDAKG